MPPLDHSTHIYAVRAIRRYRMHPALPERSDHRHDIAMSLHAHGWVECIPICIKYVSSVRVLFLIGLRDSIGKRQVEFRRCAPHGLAGVALTPPRPIIGAQRRKTQTGVTVEL